MPRSKSTLITTEEENCLTWKKKARLLGNGLVDEPPAGVAAQDGRGQLQPSSVQSDCSGTTTEPEQATSGRVADFERGELLNATKVPADVPLRRFEPGRNGRNKAVNSGTDRDSTPPRCCVKISGLKEHINRKRVA